MLNLLVRRPAIAVVTSILCLAVAAGCNRVGTTVDDTGDTGNTGDGACAEPMPLETAQRAVNGFCSDSWECNGGDETERPTFISRCVREHYQIARDCHRAEDLGACAQVTGPCGKYQADSCARAFTPCDD